MPKLESRIAYDVADWATKIGLLQIAESQGLESWLSSDARYLYKLSAAEEEIIDNMEDNGIINPGPWSLAVTDTQTMKELAAGSRNYLDYKLYIINEEASTINVIDSISGHFENPREASFQDIAQLDDALDYLNEFLGR